jgi:hypothetical protein
MNKRILIVALTAACGVVGMSAGALAQQPPTSQSTSQTTTTKPATSAQAAPSSAHKKSETKHSATARDNRMCLRETGTHIRLPKGECAPAFGHSFSRQELNSTGYINLGRALQALDPSVTTCCGRL